MRSWADVAVLAKTKGLNGRFVAKAAADLPFLLQAGDEVALVPPRTDLPRSAVISDVSNIVGLSAEIALDGVDDVSMARALVGMHCLISRDAVDSRTVSSGKGDGLPLGWAVVDENIGELGTLVSIVDNGAQSLLEVQRARGSNLLVPLVDEFVVGIDEVSHVVSVAVPNGLLDL